MKTNIPLLHIVVLRICIEIGKPLIGTQFPLPNVEEKNLSGLNQLGNYFDKAIHRHHLHNERN